MIIVSLLSAITGRETELARMQICNDGTGTGLVGNYDCATLRGRSGVQLDRGVIQRKGRVEGHRRLDLHVWHLVARALAAMGYSGGERR